MSKNQPLNVQYAKDANIFPQKKHLLIGFGLLLLLLLVVGIGVGVYMIGGGLRIIFKSLPSGCFLGSGVIEQFRV